MKRARLTPRVKVWLETDGRYSFGFGLSEILQAVERAGSIKQAARKSQCQNNMHQIGIVLQN